jgi:hypothetical protein
MSPTWEVLPRRIGISHATVRDQNSRTAQQSKYLNLQVPAVYLSCVAFCDVGWATDWAV